MKSAILQHIYSGDLWFSALALAICALAVDSWKGDHSVPVRRIARVLFMLSLPLAALAGVPIAWWIASLGIVAWLGCLIVGFRTPRREAADWMVAAFIILAVSGIIIELDWRWRDESATDPPSDMLVVFGDSLSSGGFGESRTWVDHLDDGSRPVLNLSRPSATSGSAIEYQLPEAPVRCDRCAAIIELGGNEMLDGGSPDELEENLTHLIIELRERGVDRIWLVELPVLPGGWNWAAAQRRLISELGLSPIPRNVLASVLLDPESTLDALHLSDEGHARLASEIERYIGTE